ncbi:MAG: hypothetical protein PVJ57_05650 [Phycisphaerae bacterium]
MKYSDALGSVGRPRSVAAHVLTRLRPPAGNPHGRRGGFTTAILVLAALLGSARADVLYVDDDAPLGGNGRTWNTALRYLQDAVTGAVPPTEIHVAGGVYTPDHDEAGAYVPGDRLASFQLRSGVAIFGGYAGLANPNAPNRRDPAQYPTVLSGDLASDDEPGFVHCGENAYHVVNASGVDATAVLDGVTVRGGYAHGLSPHHAGGGLYIVGGAPTLNHCLIAGNSASSGGAIYNWLASYLTLAGCTFVANDAPEGRAVSCNAEYYNITVRIRDSILVDGPSEIWDDGPAEINVTYSDVLGCWPGEGNICADPCFVDPDGPDNDLLTGEDNDYHLRPDSPCIDAGDPNGGWPPAPATDDDGQLRIWDGNSNGMPRIDMGIDEYGSFVPGDLNCDRRLNNFDISPFILAMSDPPTYEMTFPRCAVALADLNGDGTVNNFDISPFVAELVSP